ALTPRLQPDVVLLDLEMPDVDGVEAIPLLLAARPGVEVLVFTAYDTDERVLGAVRAGARGYLLKGASADEIASRASCWLRSPRRTAGRRR
ncbi:MAG: response regulator transcription factor, partial [Chloroflexi bacterium]